MSGRIKGKGGRGKKGISEEAKTIKCKLVMLRWLGWGTIMPTTAIVWFKICKNQDI